jgi:hypothetical protein
MAKTHTPVASASKAAQTSFDMSEVVARIVSNANSVLEGRGKDKDGNRAKRAPNTPVRFNTEGRGEGAWALLQRVAVRYGMAPKDIKLKDVRAAAEGLGYNLQDIKNKEGQTVGFAVVFKNASNGTSVPVEKLDATLDAMGF